MLAPAASTSLNTTPSLFNRFIHFSRVITEPIRNHVTAAKDRIFEAFEYAVPLNPLTQKRQFSIIPLRVEFFLGASLFTGKDLTPSDDKTNAQRIQDIFIRLVEHAPCYKGYKWPFEIRLCDRNESNAYCLPGCKMIFFIGLVKAIDKHFKEANRPTSLTLTLDDQTTITLDTTSVTADDVLAAVIGHEMTHGMARHGVLKLLFSLSIEIISKISSFALKWVANTFGQAKVKLPSQDDLRNKPREEVEKPKVSYNLLGSICLLATAILDNRFIHNLAAFLIKNAHSRKSELEADQYSMKLMIKAGFNPKGAIVLHQVLSKGHHHQASKLERVIRILSTHPSASTRMAANYQTLQNLQS